MQSIYLVLTALPRLSWLLLHPGLGLSPLGLSSFCEVFFLCLQGKSLPFWGQWNGSVRSGLITVISILMAPAKWEGGGFYLRESRNWLGSGTGDSHLWRWERLCLFLQPSLGLRARAPHRTASYWGINYLCTSQNYLSEVETACFQTWILPVLHLLICSFIYLTKVFCGLNIYSANTIGCRDYSVIRGVV